MRATDLDRFNELIIHQEIAAKKVVITCHRLYYCIHCKSNCQYAVLSFQSCAISSRHVRRWGLALLKTRRLWLWAEMAVECFSPTVHSRPL